MILPTSPRLIYGDCGLFVQRPLIMSAKQMFRLKLFLSKAVKRSERTHRFVWFNAFPHLPLSRKVKGMRMGKGVGKLALWFIQIRPGAVVVEFKNLRPGRANYFLKQVAHKFPVPATRLHKPTKSIRLAGTRGTSGVVRRFQ